MLKVFQKKAPVKCGENEVFELRSGCPKTCLYPNGGNECGALQPIEACYCKEGFLLDANGKCIDDSECGCPLMDRSRTIKVFKIIKKKGD